jgi:hypothetical protein
MTSVIRVMTDPYCRRQYNTESSLKVGREGDMNLDKKAAAPSSFELHAMGQVHRLETVSLHLAAPP